MCVIADMRCKNLETDTSGEPVWQMKGKLGASGGKSKEKEWGQKQGSGLELKTVVKSCHAQTTRVGQLRGNAGVRNSDL